MYKHDGERREQGMGEKGSHSREYSAVKELLLYEWSFVARVMVVSADNELTQCFLSHLSHNIINNSKLRLFNIFAYNL